MDIAIWLKKTMNGRSVHRTAQDAGIDTSTLTRQMKSGAFTAPVLVAIARSSGVSVLSALAAGDIITPAEALDSGEDVAIDVALAKATDAQITGEMYRRIVAYDEQGITGSIFDQPVAPPPSPAENLEGFLDEYGLVAHPGFEEGDGETVSAP